MDGSSSSTPPRSGFTASNGLFTTIADELAQLKMDRPFGQPPGTKVVMRFTPDPKLGYPALVPSRRAGNDPGAGDRRDPPDPDFGRCRGIAGLSSAQDVL